MLFVAINFSSAIKYHLIGNGWNMVKAYKFKAKRPKVRQLKRTHKSNNLPAARSTRKVQMKLIYHYKFEYQFVRNYLSGFWPFAFDPFEKVLQPFHRKTYTSIRSFTIRDVTVQSFEFFKVEKKKNHKHPPHVILRENTNTNKTVNRYQFEHTIVANWKVTREI